jgi:hypothetical protein
MGVKTPITSDGRATVGAPLVAGFAIAAASRVGPQPLDHQPSNDSACRRSQRKCFLRASLKLDTARIGRPAFRPFCQSQAAFLTA